jgi:two-component system LytT family response regulator
VHLLNKFYPLLNIRAVADSYAAALEAIENHKPDLVFLDIELSGSKTGIDVLKFYHNLNLNVIYTSRLDKGVQALNSGRQVLFDKTVYRRRFYRSHTRLGKAPKQYVVTIETKYIYLPELNNPIFRIQISEIIALKGNKDYSILYSSNAKLNNKTVSKRLSILEDDFNKSGYSNIIRTSKSYLINSDHIEKAEKQFNIISNE